MLLRQPMFLAGALLALVAGFAHFTLFILQTAGHSANPYLHIAFYVVLPAMFLTGVGLAIWGRRRARRSAQAAGTSVPMTFAAIAVATLVTLGILAFTAYSSYSVFEYSESVSFCGSTCHTPMSPTLAVYQTSAHQRLDCVDCHVGEGAKGFIEAKLAGTAQLISAIADTFHRPIIAPREKLNVPHEACAHCHYPEKATHLRLEAVTAVASNEKNTFRPIYMSLKSAPLREIVRPQEVHWHGAEIEYASMDESAKEIHWVRARDATGTRVYRSDGKPAGETPAGTIYEMQCVDCHNRVGHDFLAPDETVNKLFVSGRLDPALPFLKRESARLLAAEYPTVEAAMTGIHDGLIGFYASNYPQVAAAKVQEQIGVLQEGYRGSVFPAMKADWRAYPDHSSHMYSKGCFRCHDGRLVDEQGAAIAKDCVLCHTFYQEVERDGQKLILRGEYKHPWDLETAGHDRLACSSCHRGGPTPPADCVECHTQLGVAAPPANK